MCAAREEAEREGSTRWKGREGSRYSASMRRRGIPKKKGRARPEEIKMTGDKGDRTEIERYGYAGWIISVYARDNDGCDEEKRRDK